MIITVAFVAGLGLAYLGSAYLSEFGEQGSGVRADVETKDNVYTISFTLPERLEPHANHAHTPDGPRSQWMYDEVVVPHDMAVTGIRTVVENAPREVVHHLSLRSLSKEGQACRNNPYTSLREYYILSRTNLYDDVRLPAPYALMLEAGEPLSLEVMTHVLEEPHGPGGSYENVVVRLELDYEPIGGERNHPVQFMRLFLDDSPCGTPPQHQAFTVPTGTDQFVRSSQHEAFESVDTQVFDTSGTIFARTANVWGGKGGEQLRLYKNGELIETYEVAQGAAPWQWTMPYYNEPLAVSIGDRLTIDAVYQKNATAPILDAAGILGFYFAPEDPNYLLHW